MHDETTHGQALAQDLAEQRRQAVRTGLLDAAVVVGGNGAAYRNASEVVEQWQHRIQYMAADVLEVDVDARRHRRAQLVRKISGAMVQRHVHAQRLQVGTLGLTAGDGDHACALQFGQLGHGRPDRAARCGDHQRLARLQTGDFMQAGIGSESGHAVHAQRRAQWQAGGIESTCQRSRRQHRVGLPATWRQHQIPHRYPFGIGLQHLGHGLTLHHRADRHRRGVGRAFVHASAHVRVQ